MVLHYRLIEALESLMPSGNFFIAQMCVEWELIDSRLMNVKICNIDNKKNPELILHSSANLPDPFPTNFSLKPTKKQLERQVNSTSSDSDPSEYTKKELISLAIGPSSSTKSDQRCSKEKEKEELVSIKANLCKLFARS